MKALTISDGLRRAASELGEPVYNSNGISRMLDYAARHDSEGNRRLIPSVCRSKGAIIGIAKRSGLGVDVSDMGFLADNGTAYRFLIRESEIPKLLELLGIREVSTQELICSMGKMGFRRYGVVSS